MMKIKSSKNNIVFLKAETQYELTSTFMRLQEYYESPKFRNKFPTLEEYMDWYAAEYGNFTYMSDWNGFNVPGDIVRKFFVACPDLWMKEQRLRDLLAKWIDGDEKFYIIGAWQENNVVDHEFAHAFFYMDAAYRKEMTGLVNTLPAKFKDHLFAKLKKDGYHARVHIDEAQAYLSTNTMMDSDGMFDRKIPWDNLLLLQRVFYQRYKEEKNGKKS